MFHLEEGKEKKPKMGLFQGFLAEEVGFEPTCPCGQPHFECGSLQPLRYSSVYKYSVFMHPLHDFESFPL